MLNQITSHLNIPNMLVILLITGVMGWAGHNLMQTVEQTSDTAVAIELMRVELTHKVISLQEQVASLRERLQQVYTIGDSNRDLALRDERHIVLVSRLKDLEIRFGRVDQLVTDILMDLRNGEQKKEKQQN